VDVGKAVLALKIALVMIERDTVLPNTPPIAFTRPGAVPEISTGRSGSATVILICHAESFLLVILIYL